MAGYQDTIYNLFKDSSIFNKFGKEEEELKRLYNTNPNYKVSPSYGEAKGANLMNIKGFGPVPGVYDWVNNAIGGLQTAALGGGNLLYQALTEDNILNAIPAAWEQTKGYAQQRFDNNYGTSAQEMFDRAKVLENNNNPVNTNVFNAGNINVEDYSTTQQRVQAERAAQAQAAAQAKAAAQAQAQPQQSNLPAMNTPSNITKFSPTRSTAIKGGRGGRGNVAARRKTSSPSRVFKSYGPPNMQRFR